MKIEAKTWVHSPQGKNPHSPIIGSSLLEEDRELAAYYHEKNILEIKAEYASYLGDILQAFYNRYGPFALNEIWPNIIWV